jgi:hypothetical protein
MVRNDDDDSDSDFEEKTTRRPVDRLMDSFIHLQLLLPHLSNLIWQHLFDEFGHENNGVFRNLCIQDPLLISRENAILLHFILLFSFSLVSAADAHFDVDSFSCALSLANAEKLIELINGLVGQFGGPPMICRHSEEGPGKVLAKYHKNATELFNGPLSAFYDFSDNEDLLIKLQVVLFVCFFCC